MVPKITVSIKESFRLTALMKIESKMLNKLLATQIQEHIKNIIYHIMWAFIPRMQRSLNIQMSINVIHYINKLEEKGTL